MKISRETIADIVFKSINEYQAELSEPINLSEGEQTKLFGADASLDSLALVSLIVLIEENVENELGISVILADEKAMSRRTSPFSRISYLIDYILEIVNNSN